MAVKREKIHFESVDELLGAPTFKDGTEEIKIDKIHPFKDHPFKVVDDEKMEELVESIKLNGILSPVLVRPDNKGGYEMISGHRRMHAALLIGLEELPAIVREMSDDEATIVMVDSNVQREEILPSERAFAMKMKMDVMRRQGTRTDLTSATQWRKSETAAIVGEEFGMGKSQVKKYIRLTELIPELLQMVDEKQVSIIMGVDISYFDKDVQQWIYEYRKENGILRPEQIEALKEQKNLENMTQYSIIQVMNGALPEPKTNGKVSLSERKLNKYFPSHMASKEREKIILELLSRWKEEQEEMADET
ncbi:ParB/RepB/Spo0J family partition protein [Butyrivibrio sp. CB08]|uniref:ParB/RepB/Spo0J family partition protein n=1 Tax=Butyrivibrio sp. CB08 TaxID=2364879 RepID=UPI000EA9035A|nr:ParB/RepB/Spo0J family partition protein [Butyrivibrio sp. CB08]RKM56810.1 ParB/RepB/Spo0J family partition protein [Butyrivibrio sp. CB08]